MKPGVRDVKKIWSWTQSDIQQLFKPFCVAAGQGEGGQGPTNGYAILLVSLMDIWGSIFRNRFGEHNQGRQNIGELLGKLQTKYQGLYEFYSHQESKELSSEEMADLLRNNLVHNYGLRNLANGDIQEWLNIDVNSVGPVINFQESNNRLHIDCLRLKDHMLEVIEDWLKQFNYA